MSTLFNFAKRGGKARRKAFSASAPQAAGLMAMVSNYDLALPVSYGTDGDWTGYALDASTGALTATGTRYGGQVVVLSGRVTGNDGCVQTFTVTFTTTGPAPDIRATTAGDIRVTTAGDTRRTV